MIRLFTALLLLASLCQAAEPHLRPATVVRVIDGDTIIVCIELASQSELGSVIAITTSCRLYGINAPDTHPDGEEKTKAATENLKKLVADNCKDGAFQAELKGRDKYGRILIVIWAGGVSLNQKQIDQGHAVIYLP
jgi:endonuclease YncB( thermonuclease family)